ncbi:MAG: hypothetical protein RIC55_31190 [Pirellulaceae bacterium]
MKFSIRLLLAMMLLLGLTAQAIITRREVVWLERVLQQPQAWRKALEKDAESLRQETQVCESALESEKSSTDGELTPTACFALAKARFERIEAREADQ